MATVRVGGRDINVDTSPMSAAAANFRTATLVQTRDGCMVMRPSGGMRLFAALFLAIGLIVSAAGVAAFVATRERATLFLIAFGAIFAAVGLCMLLMPRRNEFDRDSGQWTVGRFMSSTAAPLSDVLAVQLINGGYHTSGDGPGYNTYQMIVVLDDAAEPRRVPFRITPTETGRETTPSLADFLGVPLLDHV